MIKIKQPRSPQLRVLSLLYALCYKCRLLTFTQIHLTWWGRKYSKESVHNALRKLVRQNLLVKNRVIAYPMLKLNGPVFSWKPGEADPDCSAISNILQSRWRDAERRLFTVYLPSRRTLRALGGKGGSLPALGQETHDIHVSEIFCKLFSRNIKAANDWVGEELLKASRKGEKLPDALLVNSSGEPYLVIEFGGAYACDRVDSFHKDCVYRQLPYQLW